MVVAALARSADAEPMMEINTTPLIDVMLVLIIMLIITIPLQSHAVKLDLPRGGVVTGIELDKNRLTITAAGGLRWNDRSIAHEELKALLDASAQMDPAPELHLQPDPLAPYSAVDKVLAMTKRAQVTRVGFVGNEAYAQF